ncbi:hypothetical protein BOX15_Mlig028855g2, partial [Macrostomum lignano]
LQLLTRTLSPAQLRLALHPRRLSTAAEQPEKFDIACLQYLVCPLSRCSLAYNPARRELVSSNFQFAYPVRGGSIPMLSPHYGRQLTDEEVSLLQAGAAGWTLVASPSVRSNSPDKADGSNGTG